MGKCGCLLLIGLVVGYASSTNASPMFNGLEQPQSTYVLHELPYAYDGLQPFVDNETVQVHYEGHHRAYTNKMNAALKEWETMDAAKELHGTSILNILKNIHHVPAVIQTQIRNNAGGYVNHIIYWSCMSPNPEGVQRMPSGGLLDDIKKSFGTHEEFRNLFTNTAAKLFGSGYVWLSRIRESEEKPLLISTTKDQDSPLHENLQPVLVLDVWEHAYYLKHKNMRLKYIADWWNVVDWSAVELMDDWWTTFKLQDIGVIDDADNDFMGHDEF